MRSRRPGLDSRFGTRSMQEFPVVVGAGPYAAARGAQAPVMHAEGGVAEPARVLMAG